MMYMWIALGILLFLAVVVTVILMLPVYIIIKNGDGGEFILLYRFLGRTFGDEPRSDSPVIKAVMSATGIDRLKIQTIKRGIRKGGIDITVQQTFSVLMSLLTELRDILRFCVAKKLKVIIISTDDDPGSAAVNHGICCACAYPVLGFLKSELKKVSKRGEHIDIRCDFNADEDTFIYDLLIRVRVVYLLRALIHIIVREARRQIDDSES